MRPAPPLAFHSPNSVQSDRHDGQLQILREHSNSRSKRHHLSVFRVVHFPFRKNQHAIPAVHGFSRKTKALAKSRKLRQRKYIEQRRHQKISQLVRPTLRKKPFARRPSHPHQRLAAHRRRQPLPVPCRKRRKNQSHIHAPRNVIRNHDRRTLQPAQILPADHAGVSKNHRGRPNQPIVNSEPKPTHRLPLCPPWIRVFALPRRRLPQKPPYIGYRVRLRKRRLIELDFVPLLDRRQQFHSIERRQTFQRTVRWHRERQSC